LPASGGDERIGVAELLACLKHLIRSRVIAVIGPMDTMSRGFAIGSALSCGTTRIQVYWWTCESELHRDAVIGQPHERCWHRLPAWDIGTLGEATILAREIARFGQEGRV
jgi:hypothetical protein